MRVEFTYQVGGGNIVHFDDFEAQWDDLCRCSIRENSQLPGDR